jgi:hypothetical protein
MYKLMRHSNLVQEIHHIKPRSLVMNTRAGRVTCGISPTTVIRFQKASERAPVSKELFCHLSKVAELPCK